MIFPLNVASTLGFAGYSLNPSIASHNSLDNIIKSPEPQGAEFFS